MTPDADATTTNRFYTQYDMNDPELAANWEDVVSELHQGCPVARSEVGEGYWVLNTYADVSKCAVDWETFTSTEGYTPNRPEGQPKWYPVECDPPVHTSLRTALDPYFTPKAVARHEPEIVAHADALLDRIADQEQVDVSMAYSGALPGWVFCGTLCGMPIEDLPWLQDRLAIGLTGPVEQRGAAFGEAYAYFDRFLQSRADAPRRDDVVDAMLSVDFPGYDWDMKVGTMAQVVTAGLMTTGHVMNSALLHLARHPEVRAKLEAEPKLWPRAIEEFTRAFAPSPHNGRVATRDIEIAGRKISKGDWVMLGYGAASRDPRVNPEPDRVDIARSPNRHVAFGAGIHRCIGAHLARLEMRIGLQRFLARFPDYRVAPDFVPTYEMSIVRTMVSLPVQL